MTKKDLRLEYNRATGHHMDEYADEKATSSYVKWLEEELICIRNSLGITESILDALKKAKR